MRRILLIEDTHQKAVAIRRVVSEFLGPIEGKPVESESDPRIQTITDVAIAYDLLGSEKNWSVILLDMTFLSMTGARDRLAVESMAGVNILQYMARLDIPWPVVVLTQHQRFAAAGRQSIGSLVELDDMLRRAFPGNYKRLIYVDLASTEWTIELLESLKTICTGHNEN